MNVPRITDGLDASYIKEQRNRTPEAGRLPEVTMDHGDFHTMWAFAIDTCDAHDTPGVIHAMLELHKRLWTWCPKEHV